MNIEVKKSVVIYRIELPENEFKLLLASVDCFLKYAPIDKYDEKNIEKIKTMLFYMKETIKDTRSDIS